MIRASTCCILLSLLWSGLAFAQPRYGQLVLSSIGSPYQVYVLDRSDHVFSTLGPPTTQYPNWITMAKDNSSLVVALSGSPHDALAILTAGGVYWNFANLGTTGSPNGVDLDQYGLAYVVSSSTLNNLRLVTTGGLVQVYPLKGIPAILNNVCVDEETGNLLLPIFQSGLLLELDVPTNQLRTIASGHDSITSVDVEPQTGNYILTTLTQPQVRVISRTGKLVTAMYSVGANAVKVDDVTGTYYVASGDTVHEIAPNGYFANTWRSPGRSWTSVEMYGSRQISGQGPAWAGSRYQIDFSFRGMGNASYLGFLALSMRPGIPIQGGRFNLAPDALFLATLGGVNPFVTGFVGVLNPSGNATGYIDIPAFAPTGFTFFASGIAWKSGWFQFGNTIGITVR